MPVCHGDDEIIFSGVIEGEPVPYRTLGVPFPQQGVVYDAFHPTSRDRCPLVVRHGYKLERLLWPWVTRDHLATPASRDLLRVRGEHNHGRILRNEGLCDPALLIKLTHQTRSIGIE